MSESAQRVSRDSRETMLHSRDSAYLIAKGYITLIKDTMDVDETDEDELLEQIKKNKEDEKKRQSKKDSGDNKPRINTEAILPSEKKKPELKDTLND